MHKKDFLILSLIIIIFLLIGLLFTFVNRYLYKKKSTQSLGLKCLHNSGECST